MAGQRCLTLDVSFGLRARFHWDAVFVIVYIAVVALLGLSTDAKLVADLVEQLICVFGSEQIRSRSKITSESIIKHQIIFVQYLINHNEERNN